MKRLLYSFILSSLLLAACGNTTEIATVPPLPTISPVDRQTRVLEAVIAAVDQQYIYSDLGGVNWQSLQGQYQDKIKDGLSNTDFEQAMGALVSELPDGSVIYQTRTERLDLELENTSLYSGIGAYISVRLEPEPHVVIMSIIEGSPAQQAGLRAHDSIYVIDGTPVTAEEGLEVVQRVRGEAGTAVTLEVESPGEPRRTVKVTRAKLNAADVLEAFMLGDTGVVYVRFPVTTDTATMEVMASVMQTVQSRGNVRGLVIDLRVARSGGAWPLTEMLTLFGNGTLGQFYTREENTPVTVKGFDLGGSQNLPLTILVGPDTEGQPEIFAAALQDAERATVIGLPTAGRIFGYTTVPLPDGSRVTIATSSYKTESGQDLGESGVIPDLELESDWDEVNASNDPLIDKALEVILK